MDRKISTLFLLFMLILPAVLFFSGISQQKNQPQKKSRLELIHSDVSRGTVRNGVPIKILEGRVHARQDSLELICDRAVYDEFSEVIHLEGHVCLRRGLDTLYANEVQYFEATKIAVAEGDVRVHRPDQFLQSDYLEYHYQTDQIRAIGDLFLADFTNFIYISGESGEYIPADHFSYVKGRSHLWRIDSTSTDTLHIYSKQLQYFFGEQKRAVAKDSVNIYQDNLHAKCDSAIYLVEQDVVSLESQPSAVQENNEVFGSHMKLILRDRELEQIQVTGNAYAVSTLDSIQNRENRLEGKELIMFLSDRKMDKIYAISNARSLYHLKEQAEDRGINVATADTIKAFLKKNELDSIAVIGGSRGTLYPPDYKGEITED